VLCIVAGIQAQVPKRKKTFWSRPLIALLFFLQPIERGWARYRGRLSLNQTPLSAHGSLDAEHLKQQGAVNDEVLYWADHWVERYEFLNAILRRLDQDGWQNKTDEGWSEYDIEINGSRWAELHLLTVAEGHGRGRQLLRCRLKATWSLLGRVTFWSALGFMILVWRAVPWVYGLPLILVTLVGLYLFLRSEKKELQRLIVLLIDDVAKSLHLSRLKPQPPGESKS
jgi:hypothetical protein